MAYSNNAGSPWNNEPQFEGPGFGSVAVPMTQVDRKTFITRTYLHLLGAILAFVGLEVAIFKSGLADKITHALMGGGQMSWLLVLGAFMGVSWLASRLANRAISLPAQYGGLALYVAAEAIIFVPLLWVADNYAPGAIKSAAACTILGFVGLTCIAVGTGKDFSFLRGILMWGGICALVAIVASILFGFELGTFFSVAMVALAGGAILYDTSNILRTYPTDRYVSASLQLFASVALMLWYLLRIFMDRR